MFEVRITPFSSSRYHVTEFGDFDKAEEFATLAGRYAYVDEVSIYSDGYIVMFYNFETNRLVSNVFYI